MFWVDEALQSSVYLDGVITVVDCLNIERSLDIHDNMQHGLSTAHLQISHADVLLVNKVDLVSKNVKTAILERVRSINSIAKLHETQYARINLNAILDLHAYDAIAFSAEEFNRDSAGHLDHVHRIKFLTNDSTSPHYPLDFLGYQIVNGRKAMLGYELCYGREYYQA